MTSVTVVNFSHPLTAEQVEQVAVLAGADVHDVLPAANQLDLAAPIPEQVRGIVDEVGLTARDWQTRPLVVILPGMSVFTAVLLAELHGRMGFFPTVAVQRRAAGPVGVFEVVQLISVQSVREEARARR